MAFPTKLLNEGEEVELDLNPHWSTLVKPVALLVVMVVVTIVVARWTYAGYVAGAALLVAAGWVSIRVARRQTTEFVVTTDRLVYRTGMIAKRGKEIPLGRVNDISFNQSVFERMIGTGDLSIESAGAQSRETFSDIPHPSRVQNEIYRLMEEARTPGPRPASVPDQIRQLDELRQQGVISQAEFDAKKQQLLDRM